MNKFLFTMTALHLGYAPVCRISIAWKLNFFEKSYRDSSFLLISINKLYI